MLDTNDQTKATDRSKYYDEAKNRGNIIDSLYMFTQDNINIYRLNRSS